MASTSEVVVSLFVDEKGDRTNPQFICHAMVHADPSLAIPSKLVLKTRRRFEVEMARSSGVVMPAGATGGQFADFLGFLFKNTRVAVDYRANLALRAPDGPGVVEMVLCPVVGLQGHPARQALPPPPLPVQPQPQSHSISQPQPQPQTRAQPAPAAEPHMGVAMPHPKLLEVAAHEHKQWVFGALAELIDNSQDAGATQLHVYSSDEAGEPAIFLVDNGCGMTRKMLVEMLNYGYGRTSATDASGQTFEPVGRYGMGFKSGSMAIAMDALVLTVTDSSITAGLLSQTLNKGRDNITIPIVSFNEDLSVASPQDGAQLEMITNSTPVASAGVLAILFTKISHLSENGQAKRRGILKGTGTCVVLFKVHARISFLVDDMRIPASSDGTPFIRPRQGQMPDATVPLDFSLRSYCEVLYSHPRMRITIGSRAVDSKDFSGSLRNKEQAQFGYESNSRFASLLLGVDPTFERQVLGGIMFYWRGRLIQAFRRVGSQRTTIDPKGVVGIVNTDVLDPLNTKQAFDEMRPEFKALEEWLSERVEEYYEKYIRKVAVANCAEKLLEDTGTRKDMWVQCERCEKWRRLPPGIMPPSGRWFCALNPNPEFRDCSVAQEEMYKDEVNVSYDNSAVKKKMLKRVSDPTSGAQKPLKRTRYFRLQGEARSEAPSGRASSPSGAPAEVRTTLPAPRGTPLATPEKAIPPEDKLAIDSIQYPYVDPSTRTLSECFCCQCDRLDERKTFGTCLCGHLSEAHAPMYPVVGIECASICWRKGVSQRDSWNEVAAIMRHLQQRGIGAEHMYAVVPQDSVVPAQFKGKAEQAPTPALLVKLVAPVRGAIISNLPPAYWGALRRRIECDGQPLPALYSCKVVPPGSITLTRVDSSPS
eukprot:m51a1_g6403 hypothetical protein (876) ;mRNA; f:234958-238388